MYTLFDFVTHVKGIEYIISILSIAAFIVFWEVLKPKPFATVVKTGKEDLAHLKESGETIKYVRQLAAAPFIGLAYIVILPLGFSSAAVRGGEPGVKRLHLPGETYL
jgi:hypothetical protein